MRIIKKPHVVLLLFVALLLCAGTAFSETPSVSPENGVSSVRDSVLSYFSPVSGEVKESADGVVSISLSDEKDIKNRTRLSVYREGTPFYHPVTKELIGKTDNFTGIIEVTQSGSDKRTYTCRTVKGDIKAGDIIRVTSSKIKLAFFQDRKSAWELSELFYNSLKDSGRFEILEAYADKYEPEYLSGLARGLGAEAFLFFSTPSKSGNKFLNVKLFWSEDAHLFAEIEKDAGSAAAGPVSDEKFININLAGTEPWGSDDVAGGELIATGDVDGNGEREMVVSDGTNLRVYDIKEKPLEKWFINGGSHERHLSIDILDLNNNGRAEIFVTSYIPGNNIMSSFVLEYDPSEGYKRIWDKASYFFRVIGKSLLMQKFTSFGIFSGPVFEGIWKDENYQTDRALELPKGVNIYGFAFVDWQKDGRGQIISFDDKGYLNLYMNGQSIWKSRDTYGKLPISFDRKAASLFDSSSKSDNSSPGDPESEWHVRGRLLTVNTSRGQEIIAVKKIPLLSNVPGLGTNSAEIYSLWWDGANMDESFMMRGISGPVTDYLIEGNEIFILARKGLAVFLKKSYRGDFARGGRLYYYNLGEK
ncbi:MAG: hypothetical protein AB1306_04230 [Nitrospirota bacterium]